MKLKRIAALMGALAFLLIALGAFGLAALGGSPQVLAALLFCLIFIPIVAYAMMLAALVFRKQPDGQDSGALHEEDEK